MNANEFVANHRVDQKDLTKTPTYALLWGQKKMEQQIKETPYSTPGHDMAFDQLQRIKRALIARGA
jgi:hypothetical protein